MNESAIVVIVPEAEAFVARLRLRHDPSARLGVPAHITVLYPFMPPEQISGKVLERIRRALVPIAPFAFRFAGVARLAKVLSLAPEPAEPFVRLTNALCAAFPAYPPYGGRHESVVPHLTVGQGEEWELDEVEQQLRASLPAEGMAAACTQLTLIENSSGRWLPMHPFALHG